MARARAAALAKARTAAAGAARAKAVQAAQKLATARAGSGTTAPPTTTPAGPTCGGALPQTATSGVTYTCTFDDEFGGIALDPSKWSAVTSAGSGYHNGHECFVDSPNNISVSGGTLTLTTRREAAPFTCNYGAQPMTTQYTSGSVSSIGKFDQAYGTFSVRAKFPSATVAGLQSALWLWPSTNAYGLWPASGEVDIAEEYSQYPDRVIPNLHYNFDPGSVTATLLDGLGSALGGGSYPLAGTNVSTDQYCLLSDVGAFHDYTLSWAPGTMTISFDGRTCMTDHYTALGLPPAAPFNQPFFMILTQALGVDGTGNAYVDGTTPLPATTQVDYVRVWQQA